MSGQEGKEEVYDHLCTPITVLKLFHHTKTPNYCNLGPNLRPQAVGKKTVFLRFIVISGWSWVLSMFSVFLSERLTCPQLLCQVICILYSCHALVLIVGFLRFIPCGLVYFATDQFNTENLCLRSQVCSGISCLALLSCLTFMH